MALSLLTLEFFTIQVGTWLRGSQTRPASSGVPIISIHALNGINKGYFLSVGPLYISNRVNDVETKQYLSLLNVTLDEN